MKLLVTSDWHLDTVSHGVAREDIAEAVQYTVDVAIAEKVDVYAFLGDLMDPDSGSCVFSCLCEAQLAAYQLREADILSIWIAGNHDVIEDGSGLSTLCPLSGSTVVFEKPGLRVHKEVSFVALPYTASAHAYDPAEYLKKVLDKPTATGEPENPSDRTYVILSHLMIEGASLGDETFDMPRGRDFLFPKEAIANDSRVIAFNGHYHKPQTICVGKSKIHIPGSLQQLNFGEETNKPGFLLVDLP